MMVAIHPIGRPIHHFQHSNTTRSEKLDHENGCNYQKDEIEESGIVPVYPLSESNDIPVLRDDPKRRKIV
jgi:hypothetical protein